MKHQHLYGGALAVALFLATPLAAQPVSLPGLPVPVTQQQTFTTGMVGSNFAPGQAVSFDLPYSSLTTEALVHAEIRGVVVINPAVTPTASTQPGGCAVFTTLEIYDGTTGSIVALTSDTRLMGMSGVIYPVLR